MAYVALYRAYRPQKFSEVVGQEHIIKTLQHAIEMNKVAHAYLFCGPRGTGKTTLAKIMAKAMNCVHGPIKEPCCECDVCKGIAKGNVLDVVEIDAASNNGADDIRALRETVNYLPTVGKYKVYIIDEVHMLSNAAFNALLKTLEEPPKHVIFILATTEPYKLPNTILSRCQRFNFESISPSNLVKRLKIVSDDENIKISDEAINQIATSSEGGMRDALSLLDQCVSYSTNDEISLDDVLSVSGNISYISIIELLNACISENQTNAVTLLDSALSSGKEAPKIVNDIILFLRDLLLFKNNVIIEEKLMYKNQQFIDLTNKLSKSVIYSWIDILNDALVQMKYSTTKRIYLELAIMKMNDNHLNEETNLLERIESLEHTIDMLNDKNKINNNSNNSFNSQKNINKVVSTYNVTIPSETEIKQIKEKIINTTNKIEENKLEVNKTTNSSDYITIKDIEDILYDATKSYKAIVANIIKNSAETNLNNFSIQLMNKGKIVASTSSKFIITLQDKGFCNRMMQQENFNRLKEIFKENNFDLEDYICLPEAIWNRILLDYKSKYTESNPKPILEDIEIGILRRTNKVENNDEIIDNLKELFDQNDLKIVEE